MPNHDTTKTSGAFKEYSESPDKHDEDGGEIGDPIPLEPPLGHRRSLSLTEQIAQQVRLQHLKILEDQMSPETEDEADDFEVGEDYEPLSKHENEHMPTLANLKKRAKEINDEIEKHNLRERIAEHKKRVQELDPALKSEPPEGVRTTLPNSEE